MNPLQMDRSQLAVLLEQSQAKVTSLEKQLNVSSITIDSLRRQLLSVEHARDRAIADATKLHNKVFRIDRGDERVCFTLDVNTFFRLPEADRNREIRFAVVRGMQMMLRRVTGEEVLKDFLRHEA